MAQATDFDWDKTDSHVIVRADARRHEDIETSRPSWTDVQFVTESYVEFDYHLGLSLVNLDHYLSPAGDWLYDYPDEIQTDDDNSIYVDYTDAEVILEFYQDEVRRAGQKRAAEDFTDPVKTLASWLWQAGGADHISQTDAGVFYAALRKEVESLRSAEEEVPEWALCYGGDPDNWRHEDETPTVRTLDEAKIYLRGGYDAVETHREETAEMEADQ